MTAKLLVEYNELVTDCRDLLEREIAEYNAGRGGHDPSIHELKEDLIHQLGERLNELKATRETILEAGLGDRSKLNFLQQTFLQLLRLDRELERKLLAGSAKGFTSGSKDTNQSGMVARAYGRQVSPGSVN